MTARPFCRYCGKPIAKRTATVRFVDRLADHMKDDQFTRYVVGTPQTKAMAHRLTNQAIVSVQRGTNPWGEDRNFDYITSVGCWDGESYVDPFFCNGGHAKDFAYAVCHSNPKLAMPAYHAAVAARKEADDALRS